MLYCLKAVLPAVQTASLHMMRATLSSKSNNRTFQVGKTDMLLTILHHHCTSVLLSALIMKAASPGLSMVTKQAMVL